MNNEDNNIDISLKTRLYEFWFIKHPICFLWLWLLLILLFSIIFSEYYKKY